MDYSLDFSGQEIQERLELAEQVENKYTKPQSGIPMSDLSQDVKDSLSKFCGYFDSWSNVPNRAEDYPNNLQKNDYICVKDVSGRIVNYDANSSYLKGQMVIYENLSEKKVYECKEEAPVGATPLMIQYWKVREDLSPDFSGSWRFYLIEDFVDKWSWEPQYGLGRDISQDNVQKLESLPTSEQLQEELNTKATVEMIEALKPLIYAGL